MLLLSIGCRNNEIAPLYAESDRIDAVLCAYRALIDSDQIIGQSLLHVVKEYRRVLIKKARIIEQIGEAHLAMQQAADQKPVENLDTDFNPHL